MYVYVMKAGDKVKIGKARDPQRRKSELQTGNPVKIEILGCIKCKSDQHALQLEKLAHRAFRIDSRRGEWFSWSPNVQKFVATIRNGAEARGRAAELHRRMDREFWQAATQGE